MILHKFPSGPYETNAILLGCANTRKAAVIDPSLGSTKPILEKVKQGELVIEKILLTHSHWDHIADAKALVDATHVPIYVHPLDAGNLERPGSDGIVAPVAVAGVKEHKPLHEGDRLHVGDILLEVIHTPGHSPGSVCFYLASEHVLISGDTLFKGSIGHLHLPTSRACDMWDSLRKLVKLPKHTRVIPGHGPDTTLEQESWLDRAEELFS
jgi:hydroxyacylglutathione hydrolase